MTSTNPWIVKPAKQSAPVPDGHYIAEYIETQDFTHEKLDGPKWKWLFKLSSGDHAGKMSDCLTAQEINPNTQAGRLIKGLLGRDVAPGEHVKAAVDACKGKRYMITVGPGSKGGKSAVRFVGPVPTM